VRSVEPRAGGGKADAPLPAVVIEPQGSAFIGGGFTRTARSDFEPAARVAKLTKLTDAGVNQATDRDGADFERTGLVGVRQSGKSGVCIHRVVSGKTSRSGSHEKNIMATFD
jgi:hypothetical protein